MKKIGTSLLALAACLLIAGTASQAQAGEAEAGSIKINGWPQWHPHFNHFPIATAGTQVYFPVPPAAPPADRDGDGFIDPKDRCPDSPRGVKVDGSGCWVTAIHFDFDKSNIRASEANILDDVARILGTSPATKVAMGGHTDSDGADPYNQRLSERRAAAAKAYLEGKGVAASRLSTSAYGENQPVAANTSEAGKAQNRRVNIIELP